MTKYLNTKPGSIEEAVKGMQKDLNDSAYQDMFKKELEKSGKGIASMSPKEKKDFFNMIDKKYKAKNEELSAAQKKLPPALQKAIKDKEDKKENVEEKVDNPYAVGMAAAMKQTGDNPPLKKSTITKAHDIAKSIEKDDKKEEVSEGGPGSGPQKGGAKKSNFTSAQIKQAYGILNDPRYRQGNYTGAVNTINKVSPGLADHPDVKNALKRANEDVEVEKLKEDVSKLLETHSFMTNKMNKKQKESEGEKEVINPVKDETGNVKENKAKMSEQTAKNFDLYRAIHSVWSNAAEKIDEIKKEAKYLKPEEVEEAKDQSTLAKPGDTESVKEKKGKTMVDSKKTQVDMEPEVDYQK